MKNLGPSTLKNHLSWCKKYPLSGVNKVNSKYKILNYNVIERDSVASSVDTWKFDQLSLKKTLGQMILVNELVFKFVEREGIRNFCRQMQPRLDPTVSLSSEGTRVIFKCSQVLKKSRETKCFVICGCSY